MNNIEKFIENLNEDKLKSLLKSLLNYYFTPSFGAIKQRDFDIFLFHLLKQYNFFESEEASLFEVISKLQVTRSKAKSLIYESNLRFNKDKLDERVKNEIKQARFLKLDGSMIGLDVEDPLLLDYVRDKLKKIGYATDGSYSNQILKISADAYISLLDIYVKKDIKDALINKLIQENLLQDKSFKGVIKLLLKGLANKALGKASDVIIENYISPLLDKSSEGISKIVEFVEEVKNES
jgi:hypothetical protein